MKITVKRISGPDCSIEVTDTDDVIRMKNLVEGNLGAPAHAIRLVFKGRTLTDDKTVRDCGLKEGDKLYAVIKKDQIGTPPPESKSTAAPTATSGALWTQMNILLKKHFREQDAENVLREFQKEFNQTINGLSLDDIERLATVNLQSQQ